MKYIRTKDGVKPICGKNHITNTVSYYNSRGGLSSAKVDDSRIADTIEELCDELVVKYQNDLPIPQRIVALKKCMELNHITWEEHFNWLFKRFKEKLEWVKLAIYTDKGLIYVAKMNGKGELELL